MDVPSARPALATAGPAGRPGDVAAIEALVADVERAINTGDVDLAVEHFAADASVVDVAGRSRRGWPELREAHEAFFAGPLGDLRVAYRLEDVTFLGPEVAIARQASYALGADGERLAPEPGMVATYVLARRHGRWWVANRQNTLVAAGGVGAAQPVRLAVLVGSTRPGRFADVVVRFLLDQLAGRADLVVDVVDLAEVDLPARLPAGPDPTVDAYAERIGRAEAFVVVTPEYNHAYPASLKQAIDLVHAEWRAKPVGFVAYGGVSGGLRAVEQLRLVFAELHAVGVRDTVSLHGAHGLFDEAGRMTDPAGAEAATKVLLDQLRWWALALREARRVRPYAA